MKISSRVSSHLLSYVLYISLVGQNLHFGNMAPEDRQENQNTAVVEASDGTQWFLRAWYEEDPADSPSGGLTLAFCYSAGGTGTSSYSCPTSITISSDSNAPTTIYSSNTDHSEDGNPTTVTTNLNLNYTALASRSAAGGQRNFTIHYEVVH